MRASLRGVAHVFLFATCFVFVSGSVLVPSAMAQLGSEEARERRRALERREDAVDQRASEDEERLRRDTERQRRFFDRRTSEYRLDSLDGSQRLFVVVFMFIAGVGGLVGLATLLRRRRASAVRVRSLAPVATTGVDLAIVSVAIDANARPFVERRFGELTAVDPIARVATVRRVVAGLRAARGSWAHGAVRDTVPMDAAHARQTFERIVADYADRQPDPRAPATTARGGDASFRVASSGASGLAVVSLVLSKRGSIPDTTSTGADAIEHALARFMDATPEELVAFEVVWAPVGDGRLTDEELKASFPEMFPLDVERFQSDVCPRCRTHFASSRGACPLCADATLTV